MIDNTDKILPLLNFDGNHLYHIMLNQRTKDGHEKSKIIADFIIDNESKFNTILKISRLLVKEYNYRCYININGKNPKKVCFNVFDKLLNLLRTENYNIINLLVKSISEVKSKDKFWLIDVDNQGLYIHEVIEHINSLQSDFKENVVSILPTPNGYHIITKPFNKSQYKLEHTILNNSPTLILAND